MSFLPPAPAPGEGECFSYPPGPCACTAQGWLPAAQPARVVVGGVPSLVSLSPASLLRSGGTFISVRQFSSFLDFPFPIYFSSPTFFPVNLLFVCCHLTYWIVLIRTRAASPAVMGRPRAHEHSGGYCPGAPHRPGGRMSFVSGHESSRWLHGRSCCEGRPPQPCETQKQSSQTKHKPTEFHSTGEESHTVTATVT